jgi:hypothetical protein
MQFSKKMILNMKEFKASGKKPSTEDKLKIWLDGLAQFIVPLIEADGLENSKRIGLYVDETEKGFSEPTRISEKEVKCVLASTKEFLVDVREFWSDGKWSAEDKDMMKRNFEEMKKESQLPRTPD